MRILGEIYTRNARLYPYKPGVLYQFESPSEGYEYYEDILAALC